MQKSFDLLVAGVLLTNGVTATTIDTKINLAQADKSAYFDSYRSHKATAHYNANPYADWDYDDSDSSSDDDNSYGR